MSANLLLIVIELAIFKLKPGVDEGRLRASLVSCNQWAAKQPGFLKRTTAVNDTNGLYYDVVEWNTEAVAKAAGAAFGEAKETQEFMSLIDFEAAEMSMSHLRTLEIKNAEAK